MDEKNNWMMFSVLILVAAFLFSSFSGTTGQQVWQPDAEGPDSFEARDLANAERLQTEGITTTVRGKNPLDPSGNGYECSDEDIRIFNNYIAKNSGTDLVKVAYYQSLINQCAVTQSGVFGVGTGAAIKCSEGYVPRYNSAGSIIECNKGAFNPYQTSDNVLTGGVIKNCPEGSTPVLNQPGGNIVSCEYGGYALGESRENRRNVNRGTVLTGGVVYDTDDINQNWCERHMECAGDVQPIFNPETSSCDCGLRS